MGLEGRAVGPRPSEGRGWKAGSEGRNVEKVVSYPATRTPRRVRCSVVVSGIGSSHVRGTSAPGGWGRLQGGREGGSASQIRNGEKVSGAKRGKVFFRAGRRRTPSQGGRRCVFPLCRNPSARASRLATGEATVPPMPVAGPWIEGARCMQWGDPGAQGLRGRRRVSPSEEPGRGPDDARRRVGAGISSDIPHGRMAPGSTPDIRRRSSGTDKPLKSKPVPEAGSLPPRGPTPKQRDLAPGPTFNAESPSSQAHVARGGGRSGGANGLRQ